MSAININKNNFQNEVLISDKTVLLDFWASWCAPCRMVVPIVEEIANEHRDIKVGKINVDEEPELVNNAGISENTSFMDYTEETFDKVMDLNVKGVFNIS